ncbi:unnamed protein product, partial [marine sediment metagenome]
MLIDREPAPMPDSKPTIVVSEPLTGRATQYLREGR